MLDEDISQSGGVVFASSHNRTSLSIQLEVVGLDGSTSGPGAQPVSL
jgi:hypothetical protein